MTKRILNLGYVRDASVDNYDPNEEYSLISAKDSSIRPDPGMAATGVDIGLMRLHIHNAPERRKFLGLLPDKSYEIMVTFSAVHIHQRDDGGRDVLKVRYSKFFNIDKEDSAGGFTYKKMFQNLKFKRSLSLDVKLTEIDNKIVDPDPLESLLEDTGIGTVLDLAPYNPKEYILLASNIISKIQEVFGVDKAGDDPLWDDTLVLEPKPTIPGSYRLREGFYVIVEEYPGFDFGEIVYKNNALYQRGSEREIPTNYLVFPIGKSLPS
ncbi:hypothetical protein [Geoglobus ahangari]